MILRVLDLQMTINEVSNAGLENVNKFEVSE